MSQCQINNDLSEEHYEKRTIGRRELLKALLAAGGAATAASFLPCQWQKPEVQVGVLPAHAQISPVPTATPPGPTATPVIGAIVGCYAQNAGGGGSITPTATLQTYADIMHPVDAGGIQIRRTITLNQTGHPQNGVIATDTGPTDASGRFAPADFDLSTLSPTIDAGDGRLEILWEFVDPQDGTNDCTNTIDVV